jgi:DNA-binding PadR family transcriptional regulator
MAHSGRERHRDRDAGRRQFDAEEPPAPNRVFRITDAERQQIAKLLRHIDEARRALERQQNADNREIIRELRASADQIYDLLNDLEEAGG